MAKHMNLKRVIHRSAEEIRATVEIAGKVGAVNAWYTFLGKIDIQSKRFNGNVETPRIKKHLLKKHAVMNQYFSKVFEKEFDKIGDSIELPEVDDAYKNCIWICWWQGLENAPEIVKKCIESIRRNAGNHKVVIITDKNVTEFVKFPDWIEKKREAGIITKTHISDLLRVSLLAKYGGVWLDSTFYCLDSLEECFSAPVWSIKRPDYKHTSVACGYFANYSLGCDYQHRSVFAVIRNMLLSYWSKYDYMIDYLFLDYLIVQAQIHNEYVKKLFQEITPNNPECDELYIVLGKIYDEKLWNSMKKNTRLFKLSWKASFPLKINGKQTFYGKLLDDSLYT